MEDKKIAHQKVKYRIQKFKLISVPANIMIGLGIYALFGAKGNAFDPLLNDKNFVYPILAIGILLEIFVSINLWPLFKLNSKYNNE